MQKDEDELKNDFLCPQPVRRLLLYTCRSTIVLEKKPLAKDKNGLSIFPCKKSIVSLHDDPSIHPSSSIVAAAMFGQSGKVFFFLLSLFM